MTNEEIYDLEIAPKLRDLCERCRELGMSFVASVEYDPEHAGRGRTEWQAPTKPTLQISAAQLLVHWAARCNGNVDSLILAIDRMAKEYGHSSVYLQLLGNKNVKYGENEAAATMVVSPAT